MIWLSISLFCCEQHWHRLLTLCIPQFLRENRIIKAFRIEFDYNGGENIRFPLLVGKEKAIVLSNIASSYFKTYFEHINSPVFNDTAPISLIFMLFPTNSVQFGLYPPETIDAKELRNYSTSINISKAILGALIERIDREMILTFAFYLQVCYVKAIHQIVNNKDDLFSIIIASEQIENSVYNENLSSKNLMTEITQQVMECDLFEGDLHWLNNWFEYCSSALSSLEYNSIDKNAKIVDQYRSTLIELDIQLSINKYGRLSLMRWVRNSFQVVLNYEICSKFFNSRI